MVCIIYGNIATAPTTLEKHELERVKDLIDLYFPIGFEVLTTEGETEPSVTKLFDRKIPDGARLELQPEERESFVSGSDYVTLTRQLSIGRARDFQFTPERAEGEDSEHLEEVSAGYGKTYDGQRVRNGENVQILTYERKSLEYELG